MNKSVRNKVSPLINIDANTQKIFILTDLLTLPHQQFFNPLLEYTYFAWQFKTIKHNALDKFNLDIFPKISYLKF